MLMGSGGSLSFSVHGMVHFWMCFSVVLALGLGSCASGSEPSNSYYGGQVLDIDTGKSLAGVLVVLIWQRDVYSPITQRIHEEFHAAIEMQTDTDGKFKVPSHPETTREPSVVRVQSPAIIFFAPGYIPYRIEVGPGVRRYRDPTRVYMRRVENRKEALDLGLAPSFPYDRTPLLLKALNEERAQLGLPPITPGRGQQGNE
jgi:hypothetical protein